MKYVKCRELLRDIRNQVLATSLPPIEAKDVPVECLGLETKILDSIEHVLTTSPWLVDVYVDKVSREVNPLTDLLVDHYILYLGVEA